MTGDTDLADDAVREATKALTRRFQRRLAREMLGAWMAGYVALDVVRQPTVPSGSDDLADAMTLKTAFVPRRSLDAPRIDHHGTQRYRLNDLTADDADDIRQAIQGLGDTDD